jgi:hypothetical protein
MQLTQVESKKKISNRILQIGVDKQSKIGSFRTNFHLKRPTELSGVLNGSGLNCLMWLDITR